MKIKAQPSCVWNWTVFLERVLEIQGCGDIVLMKYQLMVCESCILIMLMFIFFFFFLLAGLEKHVECVNEFIPPFESRICFSLLTVTQAVSVRQLWKHALLLHKQFLNVQKF